MTEQATLPPFAQEHIRKVQAQISTLQVQLQSFVDGCLCGMGMDMTSQLSVDLETMTVTSGGAEANPPA